MLTLFRFVARSALSLRVLLGVRPAWGMSVAQGGSSTAPGLSQLQEALRWPAVASSFPGDVHLCYTLQTLHCDPVCWCCVLDVSLGGSKGHKLEQAQEVPLNCSFPISGVQPCLRLPLAAVPLSPQSTQFTHVFEGFHLLLCSS